MENELMFIAVNIKDVIIDLMVETKKTNNTTEKTKNMLVFHFITVLH